jgi:hypothetical protein
MNYTQHIKEPRPGMGLTAQWMSKLLESVFGRIKGGAGIRVNRIGQNIVVEAIGGGRGGGGGGTGNHRTVEELPPIPESGYDIVFWTSEGDGNGDDQLWGVGYGATEWAPAFYVSDLSGVPIPPEEEEE